MTSEQMVKAMLVSLAYDEAAATGSADCMLAVVCVMKNRVDAGWGDWGEVLGDSMDFQRAHERVHRRRMDFNDPNLFLLLREVEDIYHGVFSDEMTEGCLYYCFVERPIRDWFASHIIRMPQEHPQRAAIGGGVMTLYG